MLVPVTVIAPLIVDVQDRAATNPDSDHFLLAVTYINLGLLIFNLLPIYPLDGGQILQALLWFVIGRAASLMFVSILGLVAAVGIIALAAWARDFWFLILAFFAATRSWAGFQQARLLTRLARLPRHRESASCPSCGAHPLLGDFWACEQCGAHFDAFDHQGSCPGCGLSFSTAMCVDCLENHPFAEWRKADQNTDQHFERRPEM